DRYRQREFRLALEDAGLLRLELGFGQHADRLELAEVGELGQRVTDRCRRATPRWRLYPAPC
ncbi:MAG TPA: hypothetical protein VGH77_09885, partial [Streptosporangiaceae bacterium]